MRDLELLTYGVSRQVVFEVSSTKSLQMLLREVDTILLDMVS